MYFLVPYISYNPVQYQCTNVRPCTNNISQLVQYQCTHVRPCTKQHISSCPISVYTCTYLRQSSVMILPYISVHMHVLVPNIGYNPVLEPNNSYNRVLYQCTHVPIISYNPVLYHCTHVRPCTKQQL